MLEYALGMIETKGLVAAIEAADAALKAANVKLISREKVKGGIINIKIVGDVAAVRSAVDAGTAAAARIGEVLFSHVIPSPSSELESFIFDLPKPEAEKKEPAEESDSDTSDQTESEEEDSVSEETADDGAAQLSIDYSILSTEDTDYLNELQKLSVHELRKIAREIEGLAIRGRQISMANKTKLLEEIIKNRLENK
jgi:ethanolamine utilization protein EutM